MKHIVSFSGGKDSTAMLLMMIEKGMQIDEVVFCDTGMEFPQMYRHICRVMAYTGIDIKFLQAPESFEYYLGHHIKRNGKVGYGFPDFRNRWCTTMLKKNVFKRYTGKCIEYHGIAVDEPKRIREGIRYPLVDWDITEQQALQYCYDKGFHWGGLYEKFKRVSCWCCPLSRIGELRTLYIEFPELWSELKRLDKLSYRQFRSDYTVQQLEDRFVKENNIVQNMEFQYDIDSK